jgi:WD40 repeat protein
VFHDSVRVPEEAGLGTAKVRLSFDAWKTGQVAPATLTVPVVEPKAKPKTAERRPRPEPKVADSKELRQTLRHDGYISGLAYTPDGRLLAMLDNNKKGGDTGVHLWDTMTGQKRSTFPLPSRNSEAFTLRIDPAGKMLAIATREVKMRTDDPNLYEGWRAWGVTVWDIATGKEKATFREEQPGSAAILAFDGDSLLVTHQEGEPWKKRPQPSRVMRLDLASGKRTSLYESKDRECGVAAVSPDGRSALLILRPSTKTVTTDVRLLDLKTGQTRPLWETRGAVLSAGTFAPDGKTAAVFLWNKLRFWDVATGRERTELSERYGAFWKRPDNERLGGITAMRFSPDGKLLAVAHEVFDIPSRQNITEIVLWDLAASEARTTLRGHTGYVSQMAFAPDGRTLATGGSNKMVKLWNISSPASGTTNRSAGQTKQP